MAARSQRPAFDCLWRRNVRPAGCRRISTGLGHRLIRGLRRLPLHRTGIPVEEVRSAGLIQRQSETICASGLWPLAPLSCRCPKFAEKRAIGSLAKLIVADKRRRLADSACFVSAFATNPTYEPCPDVIRSVHLEDVHAAVVGLGTR